MIKFKLPSMSFLTRLLISIVISLIVILLILFSIFKGVLKSYFYEIENSILRERSQFLINFLKISSENFYYKTLNQKWIKNDSDIIIYLNSNKEIVKIIGDSSKNYLIKDFDFKKKYGVCFLNSTPYYISILKNKNNYIVILKKIDNRYLAKHLNINNLSILFKSKLFEFIRNEQYVFHKDGYIYYAFPINTINQKKVFCIFKEKFFLCNIINRIFWSEVFFFIMSFLASVFLVICFNGRILIRMINNISKNLKLISDLNYLSKRIDKTGIREIDILTENINIFLDRLEKSYNDFKATMDLYYKLVKESSEVIFLFDLQTKKIIHYNDAFKSLFLYDDEDIKRLTIYDLPADGLADVNLERVRRGEHYLGERPYKRKDGTIVYVEVISYCIKVQGKELMSVLVRDITRQKMEREYITYMAYHDVLTGLLNRSYVLKELGDLLSVYKIKRNGNKKIAIIMIDLDGFKAINDTYGHHAGDEVLKEVAKRFKASLRSSDIIARLGGDEFLIVLDDIMENNVLFVLKKISESFKKPVEIDKKHIHVGVSMGVCICPEDGLDPDEVLKKADKAMYYAKRTHKEWVFYKELEEKEL